MTKVNDIVQMVYEDKVFREFNDTLEKLGDCEQAMHDALLIANGICIGGAYLGFEYDYNKVYVKLRSVYEHHKKFGGNNE